MCKRSMIHVGTHTSMLKSPVCIYVYNCIRIFICKYISVCEIVSEFVSVCVYSLVVVVDTVGMVSCEMPQQRASVRGP